jgi:hypothetical protein
MGDHGCCSAVNQWQPCGLSQEKPAKDGIHTAQFVAKDFPETSNRPDCDHEEEEQEKKKDPRMVERTPDTGNDQGIFSQG